MVTQRGLYGVLFYLLFVLFPVYMSNNSYGPPPIPFVTEECRTGEPHLFTVPVLPKGCQEKQTRANRRQWLVAINSLKCDHIQSVTKLCLTNIHVVTFHADPQNTTQFSAVIWREQSIKTVTDNRVCGWCMCAMINRSKGGLYHAVICCPITSGLCHQGFMIIFYLIFCWDLQEERFLSCVRKKLEEGEIWISQIHI